MTSCFIAKRNLHIKNWQWNTIHFSGKTRNVKLKAFKDNCAQMSYFNTKKNKLLVLHPPLNKLATLHDSFSLRAMSEAVSRSTATYCINKWIFLKVICKHQASKAVTKLWSLLHEHFAFCFHGIINRRLGSAVN